MKCPHCLVKFHDQVGEIDLGEDVNFQWKIIKRCCPDCEKFIFHLRNFTYKSFGSTYIPETISEILIRPKVANRNPVPQEVPPQFSVDYIEACLVLSDSPKASAALSRRCLQLLIREKLNITKNNLFQEIQEVIDQGQLPSDILESIDAIRNIGNFAAHPIKSESTGEIVPVEPFEADWNLDVIEMLFEYLFVRPQLIQRKRDALNAKLNDAGKNDMQ